MFALITLLGSLASAANSLIKFTVKLGNYGYQLYNHMVAAAPPYPAAPPAAPHSVLTIYRTEHHTTARGTTKVSTTNIEFHHDPGQSLRSGMASHLNFNRCKLRKLVVLCFNSFPSVAARLGHLVN